MLKIFKTVIRPNEGTEVYERDSKHRATMRFDAATQTIHVKMEEVVPANPDLDEAKPEDTPDEKRDVHETADFRIVAERAFTADDFRMKTDNYKWIVEFDSETGTISDPIDVYDIATEYINGSDSHVKLFYNLNKYRYQSNSTKTPLFVLDSFYKELSGFTGSTLMFFIEDLQVNVLDSIIENTPAEVTEVTQREYEIWCNFYVKTLATFEVLDSEGKVLTSALTQFVKPTSKSTGYVELQQQKEIVVEGIDTSLGLPATAAPTSGNRFKVTLPASDTYNVKVIFGSRLHTILGSRAAATFDVECINCISNKTRVSNIYDPEAPNAATQEFLDTHNYPTDRLTTLHSGCENLLISTVGLTTGDYFKVKLNIGKFVSWAELWVEIA